jgi:hypothetical protein
MRWRIDAGDRGDLSQQPGVIAPPGRIAHKAVVFRDPRFDGGRSARAAIASPGII